uniref:histidine kinase n=1 Tax=uncultured Sphingomonas sp. TaxID=158754 RepID=UPI0035C96140
MPLPAPPRDQLVTSSDLVRHFGIWQERAVRAPLYILHRGRPRFVLTSIETMEALCAPHALTAATDSSPPVEAATLLDATSDLVLVADAKGTITATSRTARAHFGALAAIGAPIDAVAPRDMRAMLAETLHAVIDRGIGDRIEIASAAREARRLALTIEPAGRGVAVIAQDITPQRDLARCIAAEQGLLTAMAASGRVASARIDTRGHIVDPSPALATLLGLDRLALSHVPFGTVLGADDRSAFDAALTLALSDEAPSQIDATVRVDPAAPIPVRTGLAPIRTGAWVTAVAAILVLR